MIGFKYYRKYIGTLVQHSTWGRSNRKTSMKGERKRKEGGNVTKSGMNTYFLILFIFPFMTFTWSHPWFITYPTLWEHLGLLLISTSRAVIVLYIVNSHCLHFLYNTLFFFLSRLSYNHMLHFSYSRNHHLHYCSYCSLLSSSSIRISTDHSSINMLYH